MTTSTIRFMHCDHAGCDAQAPNEANGYVADRLDGWTDAVYTHGCPAHGETIAAHKATVTSETRGRGYKEKTTWYLRCACGWSPSPNFQSYNTDRLRSAHLAHVHDVTTA